MKKEVNFKIAAGGILIYKNKVLIIQRSSGEKTYPNLWEIPSGKMELGETLEKAVIREVGEETSLKVKVIKEISNFQYKIIKGKYIINSVQFNFLVKPAAANFKIKISDEHQNFAWVSPDNLGKYNLTKEIKEVIRMAFKAV